MAPESTISGMRLAAACILVLLAGCATPRPEPETFVAVQDDAAWARLECDGSTGPSAPMRVQAAFRGTPAAQAKRFADALGLDLRDAHTEEHVVTWTTSDGTLGIGTGADPGWTWVPADRTLANKSVDEAAAFLQGLGAHIGLPTPTGNVTSHGADGGFSLGLTIDTPADFDVILGWNANAPHSPLVAQDHSVIVAAVWDWQVGYTLAADEAKRIAVAFADCHPSTHQPEGPMAAGDVERIVSSGRPAYSIPVEAGNGTEGMCDPAGGCYHGCPPPSRWVTVDARSGAIHGVSEWSLCY